MSVNCADVNRATHRADVAVRGARPLRASKARRRPGQREPRRAGRSRPLGLRRRGAALLTFYAVGIAERPADREHQSGHGKAQHLSALGEAVGPGCGRDLRGLHGVRAAVIRGTPVSGRADLVRVRGLMFVVLGIDAARTSISLRQGRGRRTARRSWPTPGTSARTSRPVQRPHRPDGRGPRGAARRRRDRGRLRRRPRARSGVPARARRNVNALMDRAPAGLDGPHPGGRRAPSPASSRSAPSASVRPAGSSSATSSSESPASRASSAAMTRWTRSRRSSSATFDGPSLVTVHAQPDRRRGALPTSASPPPRCASRGSWRCTTSRSSRTRRAAPSRSTPAGPGGAVAARRLRRRRPAQAGDAPASSTSPGSSSTSNRFCP